jgi:hypothetical protein
MAATVHIERVQDTLANILSDLDAGQSALLTNDDNQHVYRISNTWYYPAVNKTTDSLGSVTYQDVIFNDVEADNDLIAARYVSHKGDTDTRIAFSDDQVDLTIGGVDFMTAIEGADDSIEFNPDESDIDFIVNACGS